MDRRQIFWGVAQARAPGQRDSTLADSRFVGFFLLFPFLSISSFFLPSFFFFPLPPPAAGGGDGECPESPVGSPAGSPARGAGRGAGGGRGGTGTDLHVRGQVARPGGPRTPEICEVRLRGPRACRRADCLMWYRGPCRGEWFRAGREKKRFFSSLKIGIVMVLDYFTGGVNIACYPVYLLKISV